ncbi:MAG: hypothetical protein QXU93_08140 [Thermoproteus sp.]
MVSEEFEKTFSLEPLDVQCYHDNTVTKLVVSGVYRCKNGKVKGKITVYRYDNGVSWKSKLERERKRDKDGGKLPDYVFDLLDVLGEIEVLPNGNIRTIFGEVPPEDLKRCTDLECVKKKTEEYRNHIEHIKREELRREVYKALAERLTEMFGMPVRIAGEDIRAIFKALDVLTTYAEFGIPLRELKYAFMRMAYYKERVALVDDMVDNMVVGDDRVLWPMLRLIDIKERIHEETVDGVKFRYIVKGDSSFGVVFAYDVVE